MKRSLALISASAIALAMAACSKAPGETAAAPQAPAQATADATAHDHEAMAGPAAADAPQMAQAAAAPGPQAQQAAAAAAPASAATVADFTLNDTSGRAHHLYALADKAAIVLIMQGNGCPLSRKMTPDVQTIVSAFGPRNVEFLMVNSNMQDAAPAIATEASEFRFPVPVLKDEGQHVGRAINARRTTEVFLIQPRTWKVLYHGPMDDRLDFTSERQVAQHTYLKDALDQMLAGHPVTVQALEAKGCLINYS
jgi:thiol-disulfide isomerase/thioredoxin